MKTVALDTETFLILPGLKAPNMVCCSWALSEEENGVAHHSDPELYDAVRDTLTKHRSVYANAPFDLAVFGRKWPDLIPTIFEALDDGRIHDVLLREKLLDLARGTFRFEEDEDGNVKKKGYSLFAVAQRRLGIRLDKDTYRMRYHELYPLPLDQWPEGAIRYAASDAVSTLQIYEAQDHPKIRKYLKNEAAQTRAAWALYLMTCWGFRTNTEAVAKLRRQVSEIIDEVKDDLIAEGLVRTDGTKNQKAATRRMLEAVPPSELRWTTKGEEALMDLGRDKLIETAREKGKFVSLNEESCMMSRDPVLRAYSLYTRFNNLLTGSVKHLEAGTVVPIQSRFEVLMETGRTSSSGPNIQNLRRAVKVNGKEVANVRECFVPRDGHVLIACDYSAAELHTLAQFCFDMFGFSNLADALNSGQDVHSLLGSQMLGLDYDEFMRRKTTGDPDCLQARQLAKAGNFGFPGGCSAARFVGFAAGYGVDIDVRDGEKLRKRWFAAWPEMKKLFDFVSRDCNNGDGLWYHMMLPRSGRLRNRCTYTAACNTTFQGPASDGAKAALYAVTKEQRLDRSSPLFGSRCVNFVHDEIIVEAREDDRMHDAAMALSAVMEREFNVFVPDVPTTAEPAIMRYWSKIAKPVFDDDGKLIPWPQDESEAA